MGVLIEIQFAGHEVVTWDLQPNCERYEDIMDALVSTPNQYGWVDGMGFRAREVSPARKTYPVAFRIGPGQLESGAKYSLAICIQGNYQSSTPALLARELAPNEIQRLLQREELNTEDRNKLERALDLLEGDQ